MSTPLGSPHPEGISADVGAGYRSRNAHATLGPSRCVTPPEPGRLMECPLPWTPPIWEQAPPLRWQTNARGLFLLFRRLIVTNPAVQLGVVRATLLENGMVSAHQMTYTRGITRTAHYIHQLRKAGWVILTKKETGHMAEYILVSPGGPVEAEVADR